MIKRNEVFVACCTTLVLCILASVGFCPASPDQGYMEAHDYSVGDWNWWLHAQVQAEWQVQPGPPPYKMLIAESYKGERGSSAGVWISYYLTLEYGYGSQTFSSQVKAPGTLVQEYLSACCQNAYCRASSEFGNWYGYYWTAVTSWVQVSVS